jgi:hypothetical protein
MKREERTLRSGATAGTTSPQEDNRRACLTVEPPVTVTVWVRRSSWFLVAPRFLATLDLSCTVKTDL